MAQQSALSQVQWPAVVKLHGEDELIFVANQSSFELTPQLRAMRFQHQDVLIDSAGGVFNIGVSYPLSLRLTDSTLSLDDVIALIRLHLASKDMCCVSKFYAHTIAEAYQTVFLMIKLERT